jgi:tetratricopeptide (TPR) repeat protein
MRRRTPHPLHSAARPNDASSPPGRVRLYAGLIVLAGILAYSNSLSGPFIFDDDHSVVTNEQIRQLWPWTAFLTGEADRPVAGRPVVNVSFALNYALGGLDVRGYHLWNLATHLANALLLFGIVRQTLHMPGVRERFGAASTDFAGACAILWMLHPLQTEAVNYITQRTELMMGLFYLLTVYASIRALHPRHAALWKTVAAVACALGMGSKESMATAPLMVAVYDRVFVFESFRQAWRLRRRLYTALAASWLLLAALMWSGPRGLSAGFSSGVSPWTYVLNQTIMIVQYLRLSVWPRSLVVDYGLPHALSVADVMPYALGVVLLLLVVAVAVIVRPRLGFLGLWFFVTLAPTSSIVPIATEVGAERRMYLPLAALVVLAVTLAHQLWDRLSGAGTGQSLWLKVRLASIWIVFLGLSAALAARTVLRNREYASGISIAQTVIERRPHGRAHHLLAAELMKAGRGDDALAHLREAIAGDPKAHYSLGAELLARGDVDTAIGHLREFIRLEPATANVIPARAMIGSALLNNGQPAAAAAEFRRILEIMPSHAEAHRDLANALFAQQQFELASVHYRVYLAGRADDFGSLTNMGISLAAAGQVDEAISWFQRAVDVDRNSSAAYRNLAKALYDARDFSGAAIHARQALALKPGDAALHDLLGVALLSQQKVGDAIAQFQQALQIDPAFAEAREHLARAGQLRDSPGGRH